jgi:hypothetical protein
MAEPRPGTLLISCETTDCRSYFALSCIPVPDRFTMLVSRLMVSRLMMPSLDALSA